MKDFDTYDFSVLPQLSKPKVLELSRCEWIEHKHNCCLVEHGTGKTHIAVALGQAACRAGLRVLFFTAAELVSKLEAAEASTPWTDSWANWSEQLLICDELGYVSLSRGGVDSCSGCSPTATAPHQPAGDEQLAVQRVEPDLPGRADDRGPLDRLTHHCQIFEMNGESYRFRESMKSKKSRKAEWKQMPALARAAI